MKSMEGLVGFSKFFWKIFEKRASIRMPLPYLPIVEIIKRKIQQPQLLHLQGVVDKNFHKVILKGLTRF